jgi:hypothetical protein
MTDKPCCGNCRFWGERGGVATFVEGEEEVCLRYPPTVTADRIPSHGASSFSSTCPETDAEWWCGEHKPRGK